MMIVKTVTVRPDQDEWLQTQGRAFNLSEKVRAMLDGEINGGEK